MPWRADGWWRNWDTRSGINRRATTLVALCNNARPRGSLAQGRGSRSIGPSGPEPDGSFLVELHLRAEGAERGGVEAPTALGVLDDRMRLLAGRDAQDDEDAALVLDAAVHARLHDAVPLEDRI